MLERTFLHLPGLGRSVEDDLWRRGILNWGDLLASSERDTFFARKPDALQVLQDSLLHKQDPYFFSRRLPAGEHWRLFSSFRDSTAYLDIETNGLGKENCITTVAVFDGREVFTFVRGESLDRLGDLLDRFQVLVTFNGSGFDLPFLRRELGLSLEQVHLDLMHIFRSLEIRGGLKKIEERFGMGRGGLQGVDGYCAILFWREYQKTNDRRALDTLLSYNAEDVIHLETLMVRAYNMKTAVLAAKAPGLSLPFQVANPFLADESIVARIVEERNGLKTSREGERNAGSPRSLPAN